MNDKDKEAFEKWVWDNFNLTYDLNPEQYDDLKSSWQAACEYKQEEIDSIDCYIERDEKIKKLQAENAKLREAIEVVLGYNGDHLSTSAEIRLNTAKYVVEKVLKELKEK